MNKYKIKIKASFDYDVTVEASDESNARAKASDSLMDYLDVDIRNTKEFDHFHEYLLKEEVISVELVK